MSIIGSMNGTISLETSQWKKGAKDVKEDVKGIRKALEDMKHSVGRGSALDEGLKAMRGAGPLMGIGLAVDMLDAATKKAKDLVDQFRAGKISADEMKLGLWKSVPILGQIIDLEMNLKDVFSSTAAFQAKQTKENEERTKMLNKALEVAKEHEKETEKTTEQLKEQARLAEQQATAASITDPGQKKIYEDKIALENKVGEIQKTIAKSVNQERIDALDRSMTAMNASDRTLSAEEKDRMDSMYEEWNQLTHGKIKIEADGATAITAIQHEAAEKAAADQRDINQKAMEDDEKAKKEALQKQGEEQRKQLTELMEQRKELLKDEKNESYKNTQTTARQHSTIALYAPTVANKMEQLSKDQLKTLNNLDRNIATLKDTVAAQGDQVADF